MKDHDKIMMIMMMMMIMIIIITIIIIIIIIIIIQGIIGCTVVFRHLNPSYSTCRCL